MYLNYFKRFYFVPSSVTLKLSKFQGSLVDQQDVDWSKAGPRCPRNEFFKLIKKSRRIIILDLYRRR